MSQTWRSQNCEACGERMLDLSDTYSGYKIYLCEDRDCPQFFVGKTAIVEEQEAYDAAPWVHPEDR